MTWALKDSAPLGGSFLESPQTFPRRISLTETFLMLNPTLSPGKPSTKVSWCISTLSLVTFPQGLLPLNFSGDVGGGESNNHTSLDDTSFNTTDRDCSNTTNLVNILKGETE